MGRDTFQKSSQVTKCARKCKDSRGKLASPSLLPHVQSQTTDPKNQQVNCTSDTLEESPQAADGSSKKKQPETKQPPLKAQAFCGN